MRSTTAARWVILCASRGMGAAHKSLGGSILVATSAHHIVRVTVRVSVAAFHRDIDVTLPTSSTFAEVLPELARLVDLPQIHRPWEISTAGGAPLDMHAPLYQQKLFDGSVIVLRPQEPVPPPVVRDAADALVHTAQSARSARGIDAAASLTGLIALLALAFAAAPLPLALAGVGLAAVCIAALGTSQAVFAAAPVFFAAAAGSWVAGPKDAWQGSDLALGVIAAALSLVVATGAGVALQLVGPFFAALAATAALLSTVGAGGAWLPGELAPCALVVLAGVLAVLVTPGAAARAAGLKVPRVPTAGEEFDRSDDYQWDVDKRSANAATIAAGISAGIAVTCVPALAWMAWRGGAWVAVFCLCTAGALLIHAMRHHWAVPRACLAAVALVAVAASAVALARVDAHPALIALDAAVAVVALSTVAWSNRVSELEPTTIAWFERCEAAAIIAVIPLAVYLTGLFDLIRGL